MENETLHKFSDSLDICTLGAAFHEAKKGMREAGDNIDVGLILLRVLNENGFKVVKVTAEVE